MPKHDQFCGLFSLVNNHKKFLGAIYCISLLLRIFFFFCFTRHGDNAWIYFDSAQYQNLALQIAAGNGITNHDNGQPQTYRLPGYSFFLALCYKIFAYNMTLTLVLQIIIASLLPILIFIITLLLFPDKTLLAKISSAVATIHPGFILYAGMLATESLFTLFLCLFFITLMAGIRHLSYWQHLSLLSAGINLGLASLIRPVGHYIIFLTIGMMLISLRPLPQTLRNASILLFGWLCIVTPWLIRNYLVAGALFFHTLPGLHFLQYTAANITAAAHGCSYLTARSTLLTRWETAIAIQEKKLGQKLDDYQRCSLGEKLALKIITQHPLLALKDACIQLLKTSCSLYSAQVLLADTGIWPNYNASTPFSTKIMRFLNPELHHRPLIIFIYMDIAILVFLLLGIIGYCAHILYARKITFCELFTLTLIALLIGITLAYGCARLRFPTAPFIIPLACHFWFPKKIPSSKACLKSHKKGKRLPFFENLSL